MKQDDLEPEIPDEEDGDPEMVDMDRESEDFPGQVLTVRRATWREIEKRRELLALSRMIDENIDDRIFND